MDALFVTFLVLYAVVVGVAWFLRHLTAKNLAAAAKAESSKSEAVAPTKKFDTPREAFKPRKPTPAVSAFQDRIRSNPVSGEPEPAFNINDEEGSVADVLGTPHTGAHRSLPTPLDSDFEEEDVLGSR